MLVRLWWRYAPLCALVCSFLAGTLVAGASPESSSAQASAKEAAQEVSAVELFDGLGDGRIEVTVVPRDSTRLTLTLKNKTAGPLTIRLPEAFAAVPVLAQIGGFPGGGGRGGNPFGGGNGIGGNDGGGGRGTQGVGASGNGQGNNRGGGGGAGIFNVPAGKVVKVKLACVCLEFGKPDPMTKIPYEIKPLSSLSDKPEVAAVLASLGNGEVSQRVAQLAAWNLACETTWQEMAAIPQTCLGVNKTPMFAATEVAAARDLVSSLSDQPASSQTSPGSVSQSPRSGATLSVRAAATASSEGGVAAAVEVRK